MVSSSYKNYGEGSYTMVLSNLRTAQFPETMSRHIKEVYYALGVSDMNPMNCVVVSYKDKMVITFARGIMETGIARRFFEHFQRSLDARGDQRETNGAGNELLRRL